VQVAPAISEVPIEGLCVGLILLGQHHDGPHSPVEIVQYHALLGLKDSFLALWVRAGPGSRRVLQLVVKTRDIDDLIFFGPVGERVGYACAQGVRVVAAELVQVVCDVIHHRVPHAVLIVDQHDLGRVFQRRKDVVFLGVVVAHNHWAIGDAGA